MNILKRHRPGYGRPSSEIGHVPRQRSVASTKAPKAKLLTKSDYGWSWLAMRMKELPSNQKVQKSRKGDLPADIVHALWGEQSLKGCCNVDASIDAYLEGRSPPLPDRYAKKMLQKRKSKISLPAPKTLMDVLLQNWVYFDHCHSDILQVAAACNLFLLLSDVKPFINYVQQGDKWMACKVYRFYNPLLSKWSFTVRYSSFVNVKFLDANKGLESLSKMLLSMKVDKHVHAKYCEWAFGHFLLPDGRQVHGNYNLTLSYLVKELQKLLSYLHGQVVNTFFKELPEFSTPRQEPVPEFERPVMASMPQLYPIEGLLEVPTEESEGIERDLELPVFISPVPREHLPLVLPPPLKVPPLKLPTKPIFLEDEKTLDYELYKELPLPVLELPEQIPLPEWVEPYMLGFPPRPNPIEPETLPHPKLEPMPLFIPPDPEPRPCEKSYYETESSAFYICDGLCHGEGHGHRRSDKYKRSATGCKAKPPPLIRSIPQPPFPLPFEPKPEPEFIPPDEEPLPPFEPPALKEAPIYVPPPPFVSRPWKPPLPPGPFGWLAGQRPIFLIDISGTMARDRMACVFDCFKHLFAPGGQVDLGATHFDIVMYSFDSWSFGALENARVHKEKGAKQIKTMEAMQEKHPELLQAALEWGLRWRPVGTTNLLKALDVVLHRSFADCIYLLTDGKPDKPVQVLNSIKQIIKEKGRVTPIYTIGLGTSGPGERFLKRISEATGGEFRELDMKWAQAVDPGTDEDREDARWARAKIEQLQRRNSIQRNGANIHEVIRQVQLRYEEERVLPQKEVHAKMEREMRLRHEAEVEAITAENKQLMEEARKKHDEIVDKVMQKNKSNYEQAKSLWMKEVERVREENQNLLDALKKWEQLVKDTEDHNAQILGQAKEAFRRDLAKVEQINDMVLKSAQDAYDTVRMRRQQEHENAVIERERKQKELNDFVAARNKAALEEYETTVANTISYNEATMERARADHAERLTATLAKNEQAIKAAESKHEIRCKEVKEENARRQAALQKKLDEIKEKREAAMDMYQEEVAFAIAEHEAQTKKYAELNAENEAKARSTWKSTCEAIDAENVAAAQDAVREFEAQDKYVQEENLKRARQRLELEKKKLEVQRYNENLIKLKKIRWKEECVHAEKAYEEEVAIAEVEHAKLVEEVKQRNAEILQAALLEHKAMIAAVESYNETVRPYVEASNIVRGEIARVQRFLKYLINAYVDPASRGSKPSFDSDVRLLAKANRALDTKLLIEALQEAYETRGKAERASIYKRTDLTGMMPVHPPRAPSHHCALDGAAPHHLSLDEQPSEIIIHG